MRSTQETVVEEGKITGPGPGPLRSHISLLTSGGQFNTTPASPPRAYDIASSNCVGSSIPRGSPETESSIVVRVNNMDHDEDPAPGSAKDTVQ